MRQNLMKTARLLLAAAVLAGASACSGGGDDTGTGPQRFSASGTWQGTSGNVALQLVLAESNQQINGNGTIYVPGAVAVTATGTNVGNNVALTLKASGYQDLSFTGTILSPGSMSGSLNGSGFTNFAVTLLKL